jgi:hypothetical protein
MELPETCKLNSGESSYRAVQAEFWRIQLRDEGVAEFARIQNAAAAQTIAGVRRLECASDLQAEFWRIQLPGCAS